MLLAIISDGLSILEGRWKVNNDSSLQFLDYGDSTETVWGMVIFVSMFIGIVSIIMLSAYLASGRTKKHSAEEEKANDD